MCGALMEFRVHYFRGKLIRSEAEVRVGKFKIGKAAGKAEVTGDMVKGRGDMMIHWIWRLRGSLGLIFGGQGTRVRVFLVLRECIWNAVTV